MRTSSRTTRHRRTTQFPRGFRSGTLRGTERALRIGAAVLAVGVLLAAGCRGRDKAAGTTVLKVGHVGHDHQLALYVAALEGERFRRGGGELVQRLSARTVPEQTWGSRRQAISW